MMDKLSYENIKQIAETQELADKLSQIGLSKRLQEIEKRLSALEVQNCERKIMTDTNQASEDEQRTLDEILSQAFTDGASDTMWQDERHVEIFATAKKELLGIIRTEKLKLLAEVRERVVGEDVECDGTCDDGVCGAEQRLIDFQRQQLTKLEAEL